MKINKKNNAFRAVSKRNEHVLPFLEMIFKQERMTACAVTFKYTASSRANHKVMTLAVDHMTSQNSGSGAEYESVQYFLRKNGIEPNDWPVWQWVILHESAHSILRREEAYRRKRAIEKHCAPKLKSPAHGRHFQRTLLRLAKRYPPIADTKKDTLRAF